MGSCKKRDDNMTREMNDYITFTDPKRGMKEIDAFLFIIFNISWDKFHETVSLNWDKKKFELHKQTCLISTITKYVWKKQTVPYT